MGADYIECDVQITKDMQLVCSHESWINEVCNVEDHTEFSNRIRYDQGLRNGFHLGVAHSNADFEKVDFQKNL